jgi:hypothetical protein
MRLALTILEYATLTVGGIFIGLGWLCAWPAKQCGHLVGKIDEWKGGR